MRKHIVLGLYLATGLLNIVSQAMELPTLEKYTKPLLMPLLIYYIFVTAAGVITLPRMLLAVALIFAWIGDVLLLYSNQGTCFFLGLIAFFCTNILYAFIFTTSTNANPPLVYKRFVPAVIIGAFVYIVIVPRAGGMKIPLSINTFAVMAMLTAAILRFGVTNKLSAGWVLIGACLFVISDMILSLDKYFTEVFRSGFWVMLTYILGQYYIVRGVMAHSGSDE